MLKCTVPSKDIMHTKSIHLDEIIGIAHTLRIDGMLALQYYLPVKTLTVI